MWYFLLFRPFWKWGVTIPWAILGTFQGIRDEFLSPENQEKYKLPNVIPDWPWWGWALILLGVICLMVAEGAYRKVSSVEGTLAKIKDSAPIIRIEVKELGHLIHMYVNNDGGGGDFTSTCSVLEGTRIIPPWPIRWHGSESRTHRILGGSFHPLELVSRTYTRGATIRFQTAQLVGNRNLGQSTYTDHYDWGNEPVIVQIEITSEPRPKDIFRQRYRVFLANDRISIETIDG